MTDFYAAYDALDCPQQKCLVHLIRDMNEDLLDNPFDEELKALAAAFGPSCRPSSTTIDRHGLKQYHLGRHKRAADRFFERSPAADSGRRRPRHYRKRLLKYRDKLFTFLDHDGVPWNNNNAENAVKRFASRRKGWAGPACSETGLRDYLVLLSIYQTLRYRGLSFWKFLLSGENRRSPVHPAGAGPRRGRSVPAAAPAKPVPPPPDPDLGSLVQVWPTLLDPIRAGILAMVRAASG